MESIQHFLDLTRENTLSWRTKVTDVVMDYIPPTYEYPIGNGYHNKSGCYVISRVGTKMGNDADEDDEDDIYLQECEGYSELDDSLVPDDDPRKKLQTGIPIVICGGGLPSSQQVRNGVDEAGPIVYRCNAEQLFKPLSRDHGNALLGILGKGLTPSDHDVFVCYMDEKEQEVYFYGVKNSDENIVFTCSAHSEAADKIPEIPLKNTTTLSLECVYSDGKESDLSLQFTNIHQRWELKITPEEGEERTTLPWLQLPPYTAASFVEVRCDPAEATNILYPLYRNLSFLEHEHPNNNDLSYRSYRNKTHALLRSEDVAVTSRECDDTSRDTTSTTPLPSHNYSHVLGQRKNYDFTERLYELVHLLPRLHQKACLEVVFEFLAGNQHAILDISPDNDTKLAALIVARKKLSSTEFDDRLKKTCLSVDWVQDLVKDIGIYKLRRDYVFYFKRYHVDIPKNLIEGISSYNALEKIHYLLELINSVSKLLELSEQELTLLSKRLLLALQKQHHFTLDNPPIVRISIPASLKSEVYAATQTLIMTRWSCSVPDLPTELYGLTCRGVFSASIVSTDSNLWEAGKGGNNDNRWKITQYTVRELPNYLKLLSKHFDISYSSGS